MSDLEIFKLGLTLAQALNGEEEAIADLKIILERHPEMFENSIEILRNVISEVASEYKDFFPNPRSDNDKEIIAYKQLDDKKMGDIGIKNDNGTNVIFHANRQDKRNMNRFNKKAIAGEAVRSLHTQSQALMGGNEVNSSGANALSATADTEIIPQEPKQNKLVINIFGAPGVGKSTLAKKLQEFMRNQGFGSYLVEEFATKLIKENRADELKNQPFVSHNQAEMIKFGLDQSNLVICDSPIELGQIYNQNPKDTNLVAEIINECNTHFTSINLFLTHNQISKQSYTMDTRVHTFEESQVIQESMIDTFSYKGNLIFLDNDMFIEDIFTKIKNTSEFKEFTKSNRFANLVKPDDLANDDKTDKSKKVDLGICDD